MAMWFGQKGAQERANRAPRRAFWQRDLDRVSPGRAQRGWAAMSRASRPCHRGRLSRSLAEDSARARLRRLTSSRAIPLRAAAARRQQRCGDHGDGGRSCLPLDPQP
jgi:hypothetical protein